MKLRLNVLDPEKNEVYRTNARCASLVFSHLVCLKIFRGQPIEQVTFSLIGAKIGNESMRDPDDAWDQVVTNIVGELHHINIFEA